MKRMPVAFLNSKFVLLEITITPWLMTVVVGVVVGVAFAVLVRICSRCYGGGRFIHARNLLYHRAVLYTVLSQQTITRRYLCVFFKTLE